VALVGDDEIGETITVEVAEVGLELATAIALREPAWAIELVAAEDAQIDPAIELSHDLFYLKHQSLMLYAYVLMATCWRTFTRPFRGRRDS
ncbi:MAG: hypothetical protein ACPGWS_05025, partial [Solirubrobacterales bacterium]